MEPTAEKQRFDYSALPEHGKILWPGGARVALWALPNGEHFAFNRPSNSIHLQTSGLILDVLNYFWRAYGTRAGIWRMMKWPVKVFPTKSAGKLA